ncbi:hypothetical protein GCM10022249_14020 [Enteractinococcus coprophilus]
MAPTVTITPANPKRTATETRLSTVVTVPILFIAQCPNFVIGALIHVFVWQNSPLVYLV